MLSYYLKNIFVFSILLYLPLTGLYKCYIDSLNLETKNWLSNKFEIPYIFWCSGLSIFSFFGTYYMGKYLLDNEYTDEYKFWYNAFIISKVMELIDTFFIVTRSKHLQVLHWYHHEATMIICYGISDLSCKSFTIFFFMNYFVHFFMYAYYALYPYFKSKIKQYGTFVNIIQTLQMAAAVILSYQMYFHDFNDCFYKPSKIEINRYIGIGFIMYISYFILFVGVFIERENRNLKSD
jgi:hypothetical protein